MTQAIITMIGSVAIITALMYATKRYFDFTLTKRYDTAADQISNGNNAFSIFRISLYFAVAVSAIGTIGGDLVLQAWHGVLGLVFILGAFKLSDAVLLPNYDDRHAIVVNGNSAVATMMGSYMVATGIIAYSSFVGTGPWWTSFAFFGLGQAILLGMGKVYQMMHPELVKNIKDKQLASGIMLGGMFVAFAMILNGAIAGDFTSMWADVQAVLVSTVIGIVMLLVFVNKIIDTLFIPNINMSGMINTNNVGAISTIVFIKILLAMAIGYVVI